MRERRCTLEEKTNVSRITPAYAGKTDFSICLVAIILDHPRVCGKDRSFLDMGICPLGSPPRMRERLVLFVKPQDGSRITPAYAGKTA